MKDTGKSKIPFIKILLFLLTALPFLSFGQDRYIEIIFKLRDGKTATFKGSKIEGTAITPIAGVTVAVYDKVTNELIQKQLTGVNGNVTLKLDLFKEYFIAASKKGFVTEKIWFDTNVKGKENKAILHYTTENFILLYDIESDKLGAELLDKPFDKIIYNPSENNFDSDNNYKILINKDLAKLTPKAKADLLNKLKGGFGIPDNGVVAKESSKKFKDAIFKADKLFVAKSYAKAKEAYNEAAAISPNEKYPKEKLLEISKMYKEAVYAADKFFLLEEYERAKESYNVALACSPNEQYPKDKIKEVNKLLKADNATANYATLISNGDKALKEKDYARAKESFTNALKQKPIEKYPKDQLTKIDGLIKSSQDLDNKYNASIALGDKSRGLEQYDNAKAAYKAAAILKPGDQIAQNKLADLDKLISDAKQNVGDDKYKSAITKGDNSFNERDYKVAKDAYTAASLIKPNEKYPKDRIVESDNLMKEMDKNLSAINAATSHNNITVRMNQTDLQITEQIQASRNERLARANQQKMLKRAHERHMANLSTKYDTKNPLTRLLDIVDAKDSPKQ